MANAIRATANDIKSRISVGFLTTVAARAGCQVMEVLVDRDSADVTVRPISGAKVSIDVQLKATAVLERQAGNVVFDLPVKNYDDLRETNVDAPQILVVLDLHEADAEWLVCQPDAAILKRSAYWINLHGFPPTGNKDTVRVKIPLANLLTPDVLRNLMDERLNKILAAGAE